MKNVIIIFFLITMLSTSFIDNINAFEIESDSLKNGKSSLKNNSSPFEGYILFTPWLGTTTYLIDNNREIFHKWDSIYQPALPVYLLKNGDLLRADYKLNTFFGPIGGSTGRVEKFNWYGVPLWSFIYSNNEHYLHHDIEALPNGNILMTAWEYKAQDDAISAGRNPSFISSKGMWPDHVIEVQQTGQTTGDIVWEWHVWDHLIQDYDSSKDNYGVVADHPELININLNPDIPTDWNHINSIDYNEEFDQILLNVNHQGEIWVIDHSTTTEEAAGHIGGNSGKGGDLLYRWGNPQNYRAGNADDQKIYGQHDARWIKPDCPGAGHILVFNNNLGGPDFSNVIEFIPPVDNNGNYYLEPGLKYGPEDPIWIYPTYESITDMSGAQRLPSGNTLICEGRKGIFIEVTPDKNIVWRYENPFPNWTDNRVFTIQYYPEDYPGVKKIKNRSLNEIEEIKNTFISIIQNFQIMKRFFNFNNN